MNLNFIDILVAKIYAGFKLRTKLDYSDNLQISYVNTGKAAKKRHSEIVVKSTRFQWIGRYW